MSALTCTCEGIIPLPALPAYLAWTVGWDLWFADTGSVRVSPQVGTPFFFEVTEGTPGSPHARRHPHYGRFLQLVPAQRMRCTWVTGANGTDGAETVLTVQLQPQGEQHTRCTLTHEGFATTAARDRHAAAWPHVLEAQARQLATVDPTMWDALTRQLEPGSGRTVTRNRSMPDATLIPTRSYPDLDAAVGWLCDVLGCDVRLRVPGDRVQLTVGNGAVVAAAWDPATVPASGGRPPATLLIRVANVDDVYHRALAAGASGLAAPADTTMGERQATIRDPAGHAWMLSHTIADVDPITWGGVPAA
jgi:uncharacterized glyoxalase superfamily protein PhnB